MLSSSFTPIGQQHAHTITCTRTHVAIATISIIPWYANEATTLHRDRQEERTKNREKESASERVKRRKGKIMQHLRRKFSYAKITTKTNYLYALASHHIRNPIFAKW